MQLRNPNGLAVGGTFNAPWSELAMAEPAKNSQVYILAGQGKGRKGVVRVSECRVCE